MWLWVKARASYKGLSVGNLEELFGESIVTIRNHYNHLDRLTVGEVYRTAKILEVEPEELFEEIIKWKRRETKSR